MPRPLGRHCSSPNTLTGAPRRFQASVSGEFPFMCCGVHVYDLLSPAANASSSWSISSGDVLRVHGIWNLVDGYAGGVSTFVQMEHSRRY